MACTAVTSDIQVICVVIPTPPPNTLHNIIRIIIYIIFLALIPGQLRSIYSSVEVTGTCQHYISYQLDIDKSLY